MNDTKRIFGIVVILNLLWAPVNQMITLARGAGFSPLGIGCVRWLALASLLSTLLFVPKFRDFLGYKSMSRTEWIKSFAIGLAFFGPAHLLYYSSMGLTSEVEGSVLLTTSPLWTAIMSYFLLKDEAMTTKRWVAILLSFVGAYVVVAGFSLPNMKGHSVGNLMFGSGVVIESLMGVIAARISRRTSGVSVLCGQMWGAATAFWLAAAFLGTFLPFAVPEFSLANFYPLLYLVIVSGLITFVTWYRIVEKSPLTLLAVLIGIQPPFVALLSWLLDRKIPSTNVVIGAVIISVALLVGFVGEKAKLMTNLDPPGPAG